MVETACVESSSWPVGTWSLSADDESALGAIDALFAGCAESSAIARFTAAFRPATARASRTPARSVVHRDRRVAGRRRRRLSQRVRASPRDVVATTSTSVGRPDECGPVGPRRHGGIRSGIRSRDGFPTQRPTRVGRRARRTRSAHAARGVDQRRRHVRRRARRHGRRQVDAGLRSIADADGRCSATT